MNIIAICNNLYKQTTLYDKKNCFYIHSKDELNLNVIHSIQPRYIFFPHWSYKIPPEIYENFECVVFHETDLPFGRGGSPIQNLIEREIYKTKITALKCNEILDGGDIYLKRDLSLKDKSAKELFIDIGNIVSEMIDEIIEKQISPVPQEGPITTFKRRTPEQSNLAQLNSLNKIFDYIRMLDAPGYPHAYIKHDNIIYSFSDVTKENDKLFAKVEIKENNNE